MNALTLDEVLARDIVGVDAAAVIHFASRAYLFPDGMRVAIEGAATPAAGLSAARYALGTLEVEYCGMNAIEGFVYRRIATLEG
jgi:hypothetical protein